MTVVVVDASVLVELVTETRHAEAVRRRTRDVTPMAPHLIDAEVLSVVQRRVRHGSITPGRGRCAVRVLHTWPARRWGHQPFLERAWELRENVRGYDALYVALAEALDAPLLTLDARLARAPGLHCPIEVLA